MVHNTLTGRMEPFEPAEPGKVKMYVCGPTVWDYIHVGNARAFVGADLIKRYLRYRGFEVQHVQNVTDIDDKIIRRSHEEGASVEAIVETYLQAYQEDLEALGCIPPDVTPRASEHVPEMIEWIEGLIAKGHAYEADGDVYFDVQSFPAYGRLSKQSLESLQAGARVQVGEAKRHPADFTLWKAAKPGEPFWESPWGPGRPGWHIECSVMSTRYLGPTFDIHAGGHDLIFPHHENEIAQSEAYTGQPFVRYWLHTGYITAGGEKMSKSLGNQKNLREILEEYDPEAVRLYLLSTHYRSPMEFTSSGLQASQKGLARLRQAVAALEEAVDGWSPKERGGEGPVDAHPLRQAARACRERFEAALDDDFNTAGAMGAMHELAREANRHLQSPPGERTGETLGAMAEALATLRELGWVFGVLQDGGRSQRNGRSGEIIDRLVRILIDLRQEARSAKAYDRADAIRDRLAEAGIALEDTADGTRWKWLDRE